MKWKKHGLLYAPTGEVKGLIKYAILPTPEYLEDINRIRIYFASTDENNNGSITYLECEADNPFNIIKKPTEIVLSPGEAGCFDDCGVNPSCIFTWGNKKFISYIGYQRTEKIPYLMLSGMAELSESKIVNRKKVPFLERNDSEPTIRSAPFVIQHENQFIIYYVSANGWKKMNNGFYEGKQLPVYEIKILRTKDFVSFETFNSPAIKAANENEFGFGRPWIIKEKNIFKMWYSVRTQNTGYRIGYAESTDAVNWIRKDEEAGIDVSISGWDSEMICYASVLKVKNKTWMFYNGNGHGLSGMGLAELVE